MNVHFVTISTDHSRAEYLIRTSKYFDVPITCITPERWLGPGPTKMVEMRKFVADKNDNDIIIFADAYDCLVSNNLSSILEKFKEEDELFKERLDSKNLFENMLYQMKTQINNYEQELPEKEDVLSKLEPFLFCFKSCAINISLFKLYIQSFIPNPSLILFNAAIPISLNEVNILFII